MYSQRTRPHKINQELYGNINKKASQELILRINEYGSKAFEHYALAKQNLDKIVNDDEVSQLFTQIKSMNKQHPMLYNTGTILE